MTQAPGKRDYVTVKEGSTKERKQKRHMVMSVMKEENPDDEIGKSKFADLRLHHVLQLPRNVCVCRHHENFFLLLNGLHSYDSSYRVYNHDLPASFICAERTDKCWFNNNNLATIVEWFYF